MQEVPLVADYFTGLPADTSSIVRVTNDAKLWYYNGGYNNFVAAGYGTWEFWRKDTGTANTGY